MANKVKSAWVGPPLEPLHPQLPRDRAIKARIDRCALEALAYSPDGRYLALTTVDAVELLDAASGSVAASISHTCPLYDLAWSPDSRQLAVATGESNFPYSPGLLALVDDPDKRAALVASEELFRRPACLVWDVAAAVALGEVSPHILGPHASCLGEGRVPQPPHPFGLEKTPWAFTAIAYRPDGRLLAIGDEGGGLRLWNPATGGLRRLKTRGPRIRGIVWSHDGSRLVIAGEDSLLEAWEPAQALLCFAYRGPDLGTMMDLTLDPTGRWLVTASNDRDVRLWRLSDGAPCGVLATHSFGVGSSQFHPTEDILAHGDTTGLLLLSSSYIRSREPRWSLRAIRTKIREKIREKIDAKTHKKSDARLTSGAVSQPSRRTLLKLPGRIDRVAWHPQGHTLAVASSSTIHFVDPTAAGIDAALHDPRRPQHRSRVEALTWDPSGRFVISGGGVEDTRAMIWDGESGSLRGTLRFASSVEAFAFRSDGRELAIWARPRETAGDSPFHAVLISLWDTASWLPGGPSWPTATAAGIAPYDSEFVYYARGLAFSPDGRWLAAGTHDGVVLVWDCAKRAGVAGRAECALQHALTSYRQYYAIDVKVAFSPKNSLLMTGGADGVFRVWDPESGAPRGGFKVAGGIESFAVAPDGNQIIVADRHGSLHLWDLGASRELARWGPWPLLSEVAWLPTGRDLVFLGQDPATPSIPGSAWLWDSARGEVRGRFDSETSLCAAALAPAGDRLAVGDEEGRVHFLRLPPPAG